MSHDHDRPKARTRQDELVAPHGPQRDGATTELNVSDDPEVTFKTITAFLESGRGNSKDLPRLVGSLDFTHKKQLLDSLDKVATRTSADTFLEIGEILNVPAELLLETLSKTKPSAKLPRDVLQRHLPSRDAASLASLADDPHRFAEVRAAFPGPLGIALPNLADFPEPLHTKPLFVTWYVETTDPTVVALNFSQFGTAPLAKSLDAANQWSWLDHLHIAKHFAVGRGLEALRDATHDERAKAKIVQLLGSFKTEEITADSLIQGSKDVEVQVGKSDTPALLDAAARGNSVGNVKNDELVKRLAGEPASVVLEFAEATLMDLAIAIPLLASARGATAEQMQSMLNRYEPEPRVAALKQDKVRAAVRKILGARTSLTTLFPSLNARERIHAQLYSDEALRQWAYQEKQPLTYLWIAAGSEHAKDACKIVHREIGFGWVHQLPATAPSVELRRLALNCGDAKITEFVHEHILGDRTYKIDPSENVVQPLAGDVYGRTAGARVESEAKQATPDPKAVLARLGDLDPSQRREALANRAEMTEVFSVLSGAEAVRAVYLLNPTIPQLLALPVSEPGLLDYLRTRPPAEEQAALAQSSLLRAARGMFPHTSPLLVYPSLRDPHVLAKALDHSPELLDWMIEDMDPSQALALLSVEPARTAAQPRFEAREHVYDKLPQYKLLLPAGRRGFDALAKKTEDEETKTEAEQYTAGDTPADAVADKHAQRMADASAKHTLWDQIDALAAAHGPEESALALVSNAPPKQQIELLQSHGETVKTLRTLIDRSPVHVFPTLSTSQLLAFDSAAAWLLESEPPYAILDRLHAGDPALAQLAARLQQHDTWRGWVARMPDAAGLTAAERMTLDALCSHITNDALLHALFKVRYGSVVDATYALPEVKKLWNVLSRLPPAQVNQHVISQFTHGALGSQASGMWYERQVVLQDEPLVGTEKSYEDAAVLSAAEIKKYYGLDDAALAKASAKDGWIEVVSGGYKVKEITDTPSFAATVLHEVGHSVDQLLGEHTDVIYGKGGWKTFGVDQFEEWATEMGALKRITGRERQDVITAWKEALRAGKSVKEMVDASHPALKADAEDPLVKAAAKGERFYYKESRHQAFGDRVYTTNGLTLASVPKATADVAPSEYAMSAPAEYFAECYVEYYREYRGTPETEGKKGGHLATWIKGWFDSHVDKIRLSPERLNGNSAEPRGAAQPKKLG